MYKVRTTDVNMYSDNNYRKFIRIYNNIFPKKVEQEYVVLANLLIDYISVCNQIKLKNSESAQATKAELRIQVVQDTIASLSASLNSTYAAFNQDRSLKNISDVAQLSKELMAQMERKERLERKLAAGEENRADTEKELFDLKRELDTIIRQISEQISVVYGLNMGDMDRLDNLQIADRHIFELRSIDAPGVNSIFLINILSSYLNMRKTLFKKTRSFAEQVVSSYGRQEFLETDQKSELFNLVNCLVCMNIEDDYISSVMNPNSIQILNNNAILMSRIADCFQTGSLTDDKAFNDWYSMVTFDSMAKECYVDLANGFNSGGRR